MADALLHPIASFQHIHVSNPKIVYIQFPTYSHSNSNSSSLPCLPTCLSFSALTFIRPNRNPTLELPSKYASKACTHARTYLHLSSPFPSFQGPAPAPSPMPAVAALAAAAAAAIAALILMPLSVPGPRGRKRAAAVGETSSSSSAYGFVVFGMVPLLLLLWLLRLLLLLRSHGRRTAGPRGLGAVDVGGIHKVHGLFPVGLVVEHDVRPRSARCGREALPASYWASPGCHGSRGPCIVLV